MVEKIIGIARHHLDMFGGDLVGDEDHLRVALGDDHLAIGLPRLAGMVRGGEDLEQALDLGHRLAGEFLGGGEQYRGAVGSMLGLAE